VWATQATCVHQTSHHTVQHAVHTLARAAVEATGSGGSRLATCGDAAEMQRRYSRDAVEMPWRYSGGG
jgi:hypothetical protein